MSVVGDILNAATAGGAGVLTGLVGTVVTAFTNFKMQKLNNEMRKEDHAHEVEMVKANTDAMIAETNAKIEITETEVRGALDISENEGYQETIKQNASKIVSDEMINQLLSNPWTMAFGVILVVLLGFVQVLKSAIRPGLTLYLVGLTTWITIVAYQILSYYDQALTNDEALAIFQQVITIVIYLTVSCVTWWFGDRRTAKFLYRLNDGNLRK